MKEMQMAMSASTQASSKSGGQVQLHSLRAWAWLGSDKGCCSGRIFPGAFGSVLSKPFQKYICAFGPAIPS